MYEYLWRTMTTNRGIRSRQMYIEKESSVNDDDVNHVTSLQAPF